jgi:hypothetical protein
MCEMTLILLYMSHWPYFQFWESDILGFSDSHNVDNPNILRSTMYYCDHIDLSDIENVSLFNPLDFELNPICHLLTLAGAHNFVYVSRIIVKGNFHLTG